LLFTELRCNLSFGTLPQQEQVPHVATADSVTSMQGFFIKIWKPENSNLNFQGNEKPFH
jgi:hypothetical protein